MNPLATIARRAMLPRMIPTHDPEDEDADAAAEIPPDVLAEEMRRLGVAPKATPAQCLAELETREARLLAEIEGAPTEAVRHRLTVELRECRQALAAARHAANARN